MATTEKYVLGTTASLMTTELNSLASSSGFTAGAIAGTVYNNTAGGGGGDGYTRANLELNLAAPAGALTAGTAVWVWFLGTVDGTNYEDGGASVIPARNPDVIIPVRPVSGAQRIEMKNLQAPAGNFFALVSHNTGQTWASSGNTLKWQPYTRQGV
jgi:hypothetical protein